MSSNKRKLVAPGSPVDPGELREWRIRCGYTQAQAAAALGVSLRAIQNWEQGYRNMRHPIAMRKLMGKVRKVGVAS